MQEIVLVVHLLLAIALVGVVLLQKSEGGGLGIGGGGGGMGGFMTGRSQANLLTRATAIIAACFMVTSLGLAILASGGSRPTSILDTPASDTAPAPAPAPALPDPAAPESMPDPGAAAPDSAPAEEPAPATPSVPLGQ